MNIKCLNNAIESSRVLVSLLLRNVLQKKKNIYIYKIDRYYCSSVPKLHLNPWTAKCQAPLFFTNSYSFLRFMSIELVMLSNHLIFCCPYPFAFNLSQHQSFTMSQQFSSGGESIGTSASLLPMNIKG